MKYKGIELDIEKLEKKLDTKIILTTNRTKDWVGDLKNLIENYKDLSSKIFLDTSIIEPEYFNKLKNIFPNQQLLR